MTVKKSITFVVLSLSLALAALSSFFAWEQHKKETFDHYIETEVGDYKLKKSGEDNWRHFYGEDLKALMEKYDVPRALVVAKEGDHYVWISNGNKTLEKSIKHDGKRKYYIYAASKEEYVEILANTYEIWGCGGKYFGFASENYRRSPVSRNLMARQLLADGDLLEYRGYAYPYEGFTQHFLCEPFKQIMTWLLEGQPPASLDSQGCSVL